MLVTSVVLACVGSLAFGLHAGVIAGALLYLPQDFHELNNAPFLNACVVAAHLFGALIGSFVFSLISESYGRKLAQIIIHIVLILASVALGLSFDLIVVIVGRFVVGLALGGITSVIPAYLSEISPTRIRGRIWSFMQFGGSTGVVLSYLVCASCSIQPEYAWRLMLSAPGLLSIFPLVFSRYISESPLWHINREKIPEARKCFKGIKYPDDEAEQKMSLLPKSEGETSGQTWKFLFERHWRTLLLSLGSFIIQQLSGVSILVYYSAVIFADLGFSYQVALLVSASTLIPQLVVVLFSSRYLDKWGRKKPFMVSSFLVALCHIGLAIAGFLTEPTLKMIFTAVSVMLARVSFAGGQGVVPYVYAAEILPAEIRAKGMAISSCTNWFFNGLVSFSFLPLVYAEKIMSGNEDDEKY
jgi:MFS family permease